MNHSQISLLIIDPQNDFVDPQGSLSVAGADQDAKRLANLIRRLGPKISSISISLDSHQRYDISHPLWFFDHNGESPKPFTVISSDDLIQGRWRTHQNVAEHTLNYLQALESRGRYPHVIWPEHCLIGSQGHAIYPLIQEALHEWSATPARLNYIYKGQNPLTEHFSAIEAEVPVPDDPNTHVNHKLLEHLKQSEQVWVAGWARSHCVGNTLRDLFKWGGKDLAQKTLILTDTMSDVSGFEIQGEAVIQESVDFGARLTEVQQLIS